MLLEFAVGAMDRIFSSFACGGFRLRWCFLGEGQDGEDFVEQFADADAVLSGDGYEVFDAESPEVLRTCVKGFGIDFVDGEKDGFARAQQHTRQIDVGRGCRCVRR